MGYEWEIQQNVEKESNRNFRNEELSKSAFKNTVTSLHKRLDQSEERISVLEDKSFKISQFFKKRKRIIDSF